MSTVSLEGVWLNLAADPSDYRQFTIVSALSPALSIYATPRVLANGRERVVRRAGTSQTFTVTFTATQADVTWLKDHAGETVCVRDDIGTKMFGFYDAVQPQENTAMRDMPVVTLQIRSLSVSEAV